MTAQQNSMDISYHNFPDNSKRAYLALNQDKAGTNRPGLVFLAGHGSDMQGSKALALHELAQEHDLPFLRFDYFGHGQSDGQFLHGDLSIWLDDCVTMLDALTTGPQILIGSSLGGWLMMLTARMRPSRIAGLIGIAAAPDFTKTLIWDQLDANQQARMQSEGQIALPNPYADEDVIYPYHLITDGAQHLVLEHPLNLEMPVILHHGMADAEVPWQTAIRFAEVCTSQDITLILDKQAGHRYSEESQIADLRDSVLKLYKKVSTSLQDSQTS